MALEKILNARFEQKIDTYENWTRSNTTTQANKTNGDLVLKRGEIGFCEIPANNAEATTAPTILFKVGDGTTAFKGLKWGSALAADVYPWAKVTEEEFIEWVNEQIEHPTVEVPVKGVTDAVVNNQFVSDIYLDGDQVKAHHRVITQADITNALSDFGLTSDNKNITISGELHANADTATKATQDAKGNVIDTTYATKSELANKADANATYELSYDDKKKKIILTGSGEGSKSTEIDATDFIKDGMIDTVELSEDGLNLIITWNTDAGKKATTIPLIGLVDVYTGGQTDTVTVNVSTSDVITAEVKIGSIKDGHIAVNAAIAKSKLANDVQVSLGKADTAVQSVALASGTNNGTVKLTVDGIPTDNIAVKGLNDAAYKTAKYFEDDAQNKANEALRLAKEYSNSLNHEDTTYTAPEAGGLKINEDNEISINDEIVFVFNAGSSTTII